MTPPRVTVIIPTRNRLQLLKRAMASVAAQSFRDLEVVVVDDGSTDGTSGWLASHRDLAHVISHPSALGAAAARNLGINAARGELIAFLDDDDRWTPDYLDAQVRNVDQSGAALSYADHLEVHADGRRSLPDLRIVVPYPCPLVRMLAEPFIHTMSVVVCRRALFEQQGPFEVSLAVVHDWEWYVRLLAAGQQFAHLAEPLVERSFPGGLVTRHRAWFEEEGRVLAGFVGVEPGVRHAGPVRTSRSLFFARLALARGDFGFGVSRLVEAFAASPRVAMTITARRIVRLLQPLRRLNSSRGTTSPRVP